MIGLIVGVVVFLIIILLVIVFSCKRRSSTALQTAGGNGVAVQLVPLNGGVDHDDEVVVYNKNSNLREEYQQLPNDEPGMSSSPSPKRKLRPKKKIS